MVWPAWFSRLGRNFYIRYVGSFVVSRWFLADLAATGHSFYKYVYKVPLELPYIVNLSGELIAVILSAALAGSMFAQDNLSLPCKAAARKFSIVIMTSWAIFYFATQWFVAFELSGAEIDPEIRRYGFHSLNELQALPVSFYVFVVFYILFHYFVIFWSFMGGTKIYLNSLEKDKKRDII